jgi:hypothetical protein
MSGMSGRNSPAAERGFAISGTNHPAIPHHMTHITQHPRGAMRQTTAAITAALLLALTACDSRSDGPSTSAATTPEPTATETSSTRADFKVGQEASNYGTIVTINKMQETNTITIDGTTKQADADAKYVTLETFVRNDTKTSMDLTCSLPIINALIDDQDRRFDTIDDLDEIPGNPECNAGLQPGFKDEMKFVYLVPKDAKIALWEFQEYDLEAELVPTLVDLT